MNEKDNTEKGLRKRQTDKIPKINAKRVTNNMSEGKTNKSK